MSGRQVIVKRRLRWFFFLILVIFSLLVFLWSHRRLHRLPPVSRPCGRHYIRVFFLFCLPFFLGLLFWISITKGSLSTIAVWVFFLSPTLIPFALIHNAHAQR